MRSNAYTCPYFTFIVDAMCNYFTHKQKYGEKYA